ncbi:large-conductance mechanosensitive channel [Arenimonas maotaiensis]|uniref:Large-conductance mechanosensitive channel n=1 Tax=Arenimonas maotaiensis TaxID=1446479 RepID=A0A917CGG6_9GAMM|nr:large-conductance mechanosensitive channel protein MscL [Arenimonas maotaiensis]GGF87110.1 large-conductance mechanosensitive channel [Arenimonas maotaiensis]
MGMISEFKEFALRGNVVDLAVGVVIGGAFGKIVSSLVNDLITPVISLFTGSADFKSLSVTLRTAVLDAEGKETVPALLLNYGSFIQSVIDFTLIALVIFFAVKAINRLRRQEQAAPPAPAPAEPSAEAKLLAEIRDLLSKR